MGLFKKEEENSKKEIQKQTPTVKKVTTTHNESYKKASAYEGLISEGLKISGEITGNSNLRIRGVVEGKIVLDADVTVEKSSKVLADIKGRNVEISGTVNGNITAENKILLTEEAVVTGNITCKSFIVREGASFEGNINMVHSKNKVVSSEK